MRCHALNTWPVRDWPIRSKSEIFAEDRAVELRFQNGRLGGHRGLGDATGGRHGAQVGVVGGLAPRAGRQAQDGGNLLDELLGQGSIFAGRKTTKVADLPVGRGRDHCRVALETREPQQAVMIGRLFFGWNPQPAIVRIERLGHEGTKDGSPSRESGVN